MSHLKSLSATVMAFALMSGAANAGLILSSGFEVDPSSTSINTTGATVADWGYLLPDADFLDGAQADNTNFDALVANAGSYSGPATNSKASPGTGIATITERGDGEYSNGDTGKPWSFIISDGTSPVTGTYSPLGAVNGIAGSEDIFNITFNDLPIGTSVVTLYMDHTNTGRNFDATVDLFASDGNDAAAHNSGAISGSDGDGFFTFSVQASTGVAGSDLSISIDSGGGGAGQFQFAGYTVVVPEPSSLALIVLGVLLIARRRFG